MNGSRGAAEEYIQRRRKEDLAFLVVRFLTAFDRFNALAADFKELERRPEGLRQSGIFERVKDLEEGLVFDIKEKAHFLFRVPDGGSDACLDAESNVRALEVLLDSAGDEGERKSQAREIFSELRQSLISKAIDSFMGTGFHLFMILRECVYQLEHYAPLFHQEHDYIERMESLAARLGYTPGEAELDKLAQMKEIDRQSQLAGEQTRDLAWRTLDRSHILFQKVAEVIRLHVAESGHNEVLVLNLIRQRELVEKVYGPGSLEAIFVEMFRYADLPGSTGMEKALRFTRERCGNLAGLPAEGLPVAGSPAGNPVRGTSAPLAGPY